MFPFCFVFLLSRVKPRDKRGGQQQNRRGSQKKKTRNIPRLISVFLVVDHNPLVNLVTKAATAENEILVGFIGAEH
jgi:hypothetical protein